MFIYNITAFLIKIQCCIKMGQVICNHPFAVEDGTKLDTVISVQLCIKLKKQIQQGNGTFIITNIPIDFSQSPQKAAVVF